MKQNKIESITLKLPNIDKKYFRFASAGLRPFRKTGIRIQTQTIANKNIYHNYGHGGAGICLSPATA